MKSVGNVYGHYQVSGIWKSHKVVHNHATIRETNEMTVGFCYQKKKEPEWGIMEKTPRTGVWRAPRQAKNEGHQYRESHESRTGRNISQRLKGTRREVKKKKEDGKKKKKKKKPRMCRTKHSTHLVMQDTRNRQFKSFNKPWLRTEPSPSDPRQGPRHCSNISPEEPASHPLSGCHDSFC